MSLTVEVEGLNALLSDVRKAGGDASKLVKAAVFNSARETQANIRREAPHRTGGLQQRVLMEVNATNATIKADEKYAQYVEYGTKPHLITPKSKKALYWKGAFSPVRAVKHPGTKANPFFSRGVKHSKEYINDQFIKVIQILVRELAGKQ